MKQEISPERKDAILDSLDQLNEAVEIAVEVPEVSLQKLSTVKAMNFKELQYICDAVGTHIDECFERRGMPLSPEGLGIALKFEITPKKA